MKKVIKILFVPTLFVGIAVSYVYFGIFEQKINTGGKKEIYFYLKSNSSFDDLVDALFEDKIQQLKIFH